MPRVILNPEDQYKLKVRLYVAQEGRCARCPRPLVRPEWHHAKARSIGGGFREDTLENSSLLCGPCHRAAKNVSKFGRL